MAVLDYTTNKVKNAWDTWFPSNKRVEDTQPQSIIGNSDSQGDNYVYKEEGDCKWYQLGCKAKSALGFVGDGIQKAVFLVLLLVIVITISYAVLVNKTSQLAGVK